MPLTRQLNRNVQRLFLVAFCLLLVACGGSSSSGGGSVANLNGQWEITVSSTANPAWTTYVETNFQNQSGGNVAGSGMVFVLDRSVPAWGPGCDETVASMVGSTVGTISGTTIKGTFTETANSVFKFTGTLPAPSGNVSSFSGTYTASASNIAQCQDHGTFTATKVQPMSGTLTGQIVLPSQAVVNVTATMTENASSYSVTVTAQFTGAITETDTFTGGVAGDVAIINGTFGGQPANLYVWFDRATNTAWVVDQSDLWLYGGLAIH